MEQILKIPNLNTRTFSRNIQYTPPEVSVDGFYSIDANRRFVDGPQHMQFCRWFEGAIIVTPRMDLNQGFNLEQTRIREEQYIIPIRNHENSRLLHLLQWIRLHQDAFEEQRPDFVTIRGLLRILLLCPFKDLDRPFKRNWNFWAMRKNGTIYLSYIVKEGEIIQYKNEKWLTFVSQADKFEEIMLSDQPRPVLKKNIWTKYYNHVRHEPINNDASAISVKAECRAILRTKIGAHSILYCGELDGICSKREFDPLKVNPKDDLQHVSKCNMIEVKTRRVLWNRSKLEDKFFSSGDSLKWWTQSVLGGVSNIFVGYRSMQGILEEIENIPTNDLPTYYAKNWYPEIGFKFIELFLSKVKDVVKEEDVLYQFSYADNRQDLDSQETIDILLKVGKDSDELPFQHLV